MPDFGGRKLKPEEQMLLDRNNMTFGKFCDWSFEMLKNKDKKNKDVSDKIILRIMLILLGLLVFTFGSLLNNIILIMLEQIIGIFMVFVGSVSMILLLRANRKIKKIKMGNNP